MENSESIWLPLVSVITPAYNSGKTIEATLLSAMQQDYPNVEYIVVNDGSKDDTQEIIESMQAHNPKIKLINNPNNLWISRSRNIGMENASWEIFAVLDSDDLWIRSDKLSKQVEFLDENPAVGILWTNSIIEKDGRYVYKNENLTDKDIRKNTIRTTQFLHSSMVYPKAVYEKIGGYNPKVKYSDDREYQLRAGKYFDFANLPDYMVFYRSHADNVSHQYRKRQSLESILLSFMYCKDYPNAFPCLSRKLMNAWYRVAIKTLDTIAPGVKYRIKDMIKGKQWFPPELSEILRYEKDIIN